MLSTMYLVIKLKYFSLDKNAPNTKPFQNKCSDTKLKHLENGL